LGRSEVRTRLVLALVPYASPTRDQPHSEPYSKTQQVLHHIPLAYSIIWYMRAFQQDVLYFILRPSSVKFRAKQGKVRIAAATEAQIAECGSRR
jgi:hypothetical protein